MCFKKSQHLIPGNFVKHITIETFTKAKKAVQTIRSLLSLIKPAHGNKFKSIILVTNSRFNLEYHINNGKLVVDKLTSRLHYLQTTITNVIKHCWH